MNSTAKRTAKGNTRNKLLTTAHELFVKRGIDRVSIRDISKESGVHLSLVNYYFQSKENLIQEIFAYAIKDIASQQRIILDAEMELEPKIKRYIDSYIDALIKEPLLVSFVISTLHRYADKALDLHSVGLLYNTDRFAQQVRQAVEMGTIKPIDPEHLYIDILSLIVFPFAIGGLVSF
ncbi:MAG: TetR/AcrR family transcriptional regulator, partial [Bacteroidales bacterium]|nr:TetR/AcrR family transcriptional regulator [Bacteroidales bacterium]